MVQLHELIAPNPWWLFEPDLTGAVLTAGQGSGLYRAVAARASDGSVVVAYVPSLRQITIDLTKLFGPSVTARWYDPANGTYETIGTFAASGSMFFTPSGTNSGGFGDWVLVLESSP
jgi:hypothetical protein